MKIAVPKERRAHETRVAASPEVVKKLIGLGFQVVIEKDAGLAASFTDGAFREAGATIAGNARAAVKGADIVFKIQAPDRRPYLISALSRITDQMAGRR